MKLSNKKNLQLNIAGTLPRSSLSMTQSTFANMTYSSQNNNVRSNNSISAPQLPTQSMSATMYPHSFYPAVPTTLLAAPGFAPSFQSKDRITQIVEGIFVGNYLSALDKQQLTSQGITHIVNCSPSDCKNKFEDDFTYLNINILDNWRTNLFLVVYVILDFIRDALHQGGNVLIHCNQGISRSPSIVIAYLIYTEKINACDALAKLKNKYPMADPNLDFQIQLNEMYLEVLESQHQQENQVGTMPTISISSAPTTDRTPLKEQSYTYNNNNNNNTMKLSHSSSRGNPSTGVSSLYSDRNLSRQLSSASASSITVTTPELPKQALDYDSYLLHSSSSHIKANKHALLTNKNTVSFASSLNSKNPYLIVEEQSKPLQQSRSVCLPVKSDMLFESVEKGDFGMIDRVSCCWNVNRNSTGATTTATSSEIHSPNDSFIEGVIISTESSPEKQELQQKAHEQFKQGKQQHGKGEENQSKTLNFQIQTNRIPETESKLNKLQLLNHSFTTDEEEQEVNENMASIQSMLQLAQMQLFFNNDKNNISCTNPSQQPHLFT